MTTGTHSTVGHSAAKRESDTEARAGRLTPEPQSISLPAALLEFAKLLLRRRALLVGVPLSAAVLAAGYSLTMRPVYTATVTFVPESRGQTRLPSGLAGLAGQLGLPLGGDASRSPEFYVQLAKSRELLEAILHTPFPRLDAPGDSAPLIVILKVAGSTEARRLERGLEAMRGLVQTSIARQSGIVSLSVSAPDPGLAAAVANRLVDYLNRFNLETRQSQARQRRDFVELRLREAEQSLRQAEDDLRRFLERNRRFDDSPQLRFENDRLQRQVQLRQELYLTLSRELETARIEEVNDAPVFTVIDSAVPPATRSHPHRRRIVSLALFAGIFVAIGLVFSAEYFAFVRREEPERYQELTALLRGVWARAPWGRR